MISLNQNIKVHVKNQRQDQFKLYNRTRNQNSKIFWIKSMSMKSWDFVDPKLGKKISQLEKEISELKNQRIQISQNNRITREGKQKLLKYNQQCMKDILQIYNKSKQQIVEYFDKQVTVLTKQQIKDIDRSVKQNRGDHNYSASNTNIERGRDGQKNNKSNELTKISFSEDRSCNQNHSLSSSNYNKTKYDMSKSEQIQQSNEFEKTTKIQNLNTTGRFTHSVSISRSIQRARSKSRGKVNEISSFQKANTARNYTYHYNQNSQAVNHFNQEIGQKTKIKASKTHAFQRRFKRKLAKKQYNLQMQRLLNVLKSQKVERLEKEIQESNQLIELLHKKIMILQKKSQLNINEEETQNDQYQEDMKRKRKKNKKQKQKCMKQQREIANQLHKVREKYIEIEELENKNKQLSFKRKQILKLIQQSSLNSKSNQILI